MTTTLPAHLHGLQPLSQMSPNSTAVFQAQHAPCDAPPTGRVLEALHVYSEVNEQADKVSRLQEGAALPAALESIQRHALPNLRFHILERRAPLPLDRGTRAGAGSTHRRMTLRRPAAPPSGAAGQLPRH